MNQLPSVEAEITFLSKSEGGRERLPINLSRGTYRPHIVVGDPSQRLAITVGNFIQETYLAVTFLSGPEKVEPGEPFLAELLLTYYPIPEYEPLIPGATFTIREGAKVVGYGQVKRMLINGGEE